MTKTIYTSHRFVLSENRREYEDLSTDGRMRMSKFFTSQMLAIAKDATNDFELLRTRNEKYNAILRRRFNDQILQVWYEDGLTKNFGK